jgi:hypothetical protein
MKYAWLPVAVTALYLAGATHALSIKVLTCKEQGYSLMGDYASDRLVKGRIVSEVRSEELPESWTPNGNMYGQVRLHTTSAQLPKGLRAVFMVDRKDGKLPGKKSEVSLGELKADAPVSLFDFSKLMPHATEFPVRLRVQIFAGKTLACESSVSAGELD